MRNNDQRAVVLQKRPLEEVFRLHIQMVRGLVEDQYVRLLQKKLQESKSGFFPSRQNRNGLINIVASEEERPEKAPLFTFRPRCVPRRDSIPDSP